MNSIWPRPLGPTAIDRLHVPLDKTYTLLTDHLINCSGLTLPKKSGFKSNHPHKPLWLIWGVIFEVLFVCNDILI